MANKKKKARQVLANPMTSAVNLANDQLRQVLVQKLGQLFPKKSVPTQLVLQDLNDDEKKELFGLPIKERSDKIKALKVDKRKALNADKGLLDKEFQAGIFMGLKSTLKNLQKNQVRALIYDSNESNFEALKVLFDKGQVPMIPMLDLSKTVLETIEFPAMVLSFPKVLDAKIEPFFQDIFDVIETLPGIKIAKAEDKPNKIECQVKQLKLQDQVKTSKLKKNLTLKSPNIQLLKRNSDNHRVFHPVAKMQVSEDFQGDFISFSQSSKSSKKRSKPNKSGIQYKKTKMEMMK